MRERRFDHASLTSPYGSARDEDRVADQRLERAHHQVVLREDAERIGQHVAQHLGRIHDQNRTSRITEPAGIDAIGLGRQQAQEIAVTPRGNAQQRHDRRQRGRPRRFVHGHTLTPSPRRRKSRARTDHFDKAGATRAASRACSIPTRHSSSRHSSCSCCCTSWPAASD